MLQQKQILCCIRIYEWREKKNVNRIDGQSFSLEILSYFSHFLVSIHTNEWQCFFLML